ncbi:amino acid adenylation domain-containing protein, partial [Rhodococcus sp. NPDC003322]
AGGAYVPIDPDHPADRIALVLESAAPTVVLTRTVDAVSLPGQARVLAIDTLDLSGVAAGSVTDADRLAPLRTGNPAYVIFTSGSTGRPKGVAVSHAAVVNQVDWMAWRYGFGAGDVVLQKTPVTFDVSVWELFVPLVTGGRLLVARPDGHRDPEYLAGVMSEGGVTATSFVPSMLSVFLDVLSAAGAPTLGLRHVFAAGEALPAGVAARFAAVSDAQLHNLYGPTEAAVHSTHRLVDGTETVSVPMGAPVSNTQVYVLDARLHPVPVGVAGELYLSGAQLARGYHGRVDLTSDRFVANPYRPGERMYRTGDLVHWSPSGELEYLGRTDFQVKVRGFRIELGEIEAALRARPGVTEAVVVARPDVWGGTQLVGYVVGDGLDGSEVRSAISGAVPSYMVPSVVMVLDAMPLSVNGKVERSALPAPEFAAKVFRPPSTETETVVAAVVGEVLGLERIGLDDNFFDVGGNSLIATQVVSRLRSALSTDVPLVWLFAEPTIEALAARIESAPSGGMDALGADPLGVVLPIREGHDRPLFCIHPVGGFSWAFAGLAQHLDPDRGVYGLQSPALSEDGVVPGSIEEWAERYVREVRAIQPAGPYSLLGWSLGGVIAHAMAVRLQAEGEEVALLSMMDSFAAVQPGQSDEISAAEVSVPSARELLTLVLPNVDLDGIALEGDLTAESVAGLVAGLPEPFNRLGSDRVAAALASAENSIGLAAAYEPAPFKGDLVYFTATQDDATGVRGASTWERAIGGRIHNHPIDTTHWTMASPAALARIAAVLEDSWASDEGRG